MKAPAKLKCFQKKKEPFSVFVEQFARPVRPQSIKHGEIGEDSKATPQKVRYQYMAKIQN